MNYRERCRRKSFAACVNNFRMTLWSAKIATSLFAKTVKYSCSVGLQQVNKDLKTLGMIFAAQIAMNQETFCLRSTKSFKTVLTSVTSPIGAIRMGKR